MAAVPSTLAPLTHVLSPSEPDESHGERITDPEQIEGALTFARLVELEVNPVQGNFDLDHLLEIHWRVFQDLPGYWPGCIRAPANVHFKARQLLSLPVRYRVYYADREGTADRGGCGPLEDRIQATLDNLAGRRGVQRLASLSEADFACLLTHLYAALDYLHPACEGNSRTLRAFLSQLAREAGHRIQWVPPEIGTSAPALAAWRDQLYLARDLSCAQNAIREQPGHHAERSLIAIARAARGITLAEVMARVVQPRPSQPAEIQEAGDQREDCDVDEEDHERTNRERDSLVMR